MAIALILLTALRADTLSVGDGKPFARIEDAVQSAHAGDEIDVYPKGGGYPGTAVIVRTPNLKIVGKGGKPTLDGDSFEYSGVGNVPRAIFQIDPGGDGSTISNFELTGAHNKSFNGAGVRINQASRVTVKDCDIHGNDMGIMSNGVEGNAHAAEDQLIDHCHIFENGNLADAGYNHNLYLGGAGVTAQFCKIDHSLTGHNLKSRAHFTLVRYCVVSASANREFDFVDAWDTRRPNSNAVLLGNVIQKDPDTHGNRTVIHFGQENGRRNGTVYLIGNTIRTPFQSAIIDLTSFDASARLVNNVIRNREQAHPILVSVSNGALLTKVSGAYNAVSSGYDLSGTSIDPNYSSVPIQTRYTDGDGVRHNASVEFRYSKAEGWQKATHPALGAEN